MYISKGHNTEAWHFLNHRSIYHSIKEAQEIAHEIKKNKLLIYISLNNVGSINTFYISSVGVMSCLLWGYRHSIFPARGGMWTSCQ